MSAGRPKKPMQSKILAGAALRPDRDWHGANAPLEMPPCPGWMPERARKHWDVLGPELVAIGLLSRVDGDVFAMHCDNVAFYGEVCQRLNDPEKWVTSTPNGFEVQAAMVQVRNRLQEMILKTAREFGLTPAARSSMRSVDAPVQGDLFGSAAVEQPMDAYAPLTRLS